MEPGCPEWEYDRLPDRVAVLERETACLLADLAQGAIDSAANTQDTRPAHHRLFRGLTPPGFEHYAGNYRGAQLRCLERYEVGVDGDRRVGYGAAGVGRAMTALATWIAIGIGALDAGRDEPRKAVSREDRLLFVVAVAATFFQQFLTIHPYANGNGHAARFGVWAILLRYGYWPQRFPVEPRPPQPTYASAIIEHRNGNPEPLETLLLQSIAASR